MKHLHTFFVVILFTTTISAQQWQHYLDGTNITALANDGNFLWVGTSAGVVKLDKTTGTKTFLTTANSQLPNNTISALAKQNDTLWIGHGAGISKYDGITWQHWVPADYSYFNGGETIHKIMIDGNNVWIIGWHTISRYNGQWKNFRKADAPVFPDDQMPLHTNDIAIDGNNHLWLACLEGLYKYDNVQWTQIPNFSQTLRVVTDNTTLWLSQWGPGGDTLVKIENENIIQKYTSTNGLPADHFGYIQLDEAKNIWVSYNGGLVKFTPPNTVVVKISNQSVNALLVENSTTQWISIYNEGLKKLDGQNIVSYNTSNSGLPDFNISKVVVDNNKNKWIGTKKGLIKYDGNIWTVYDTTNSILPSNNISNIVMDKFNNIWISIKANNYGMFGEKFINAGGITKIAPNGTWEIYTTKNSQIPSDNVIDINIDTLGNVWGITHRYDTSSTGTIKYAGMDGLIKFSNGNWSIYTTANTNGQFPNSDYAQQLVIDKNNNIWLNNFLSLIKFNGIAWTVYDGQNTNNALPYYIQVFTFDKNNTLWMVDERGDTLISYNGTSWGKRPIFPLRIGANNRNAQAITLDKDNNLWFGTNDTYVDGGVFKYNINLNEWINYRIDNSPLPSNNVVSISIDSDNNKYFGCGRSYDVIKGLIVFNEGGITSVENKIEIPSHYILKQNYPNPFNPVTTINYQLPYSNYVTLKVYNILGEEIATLVNGEQKAGNHTIAFNASKISTGVYFYKLQAGSFTEIKKMVVVK